MRAAFIILCALLLIGCSTERRCARAANRCAVLWKSDTVRVHDSILITRRTIDTVLRWEWMTVHDTVTITQGRAKIRIVRLPGDSIWVQGECADTVVRYVRQEIVKRVEVGQRFPCWALWLTGALFVVFWPRFRRRN